MDAYTVRSAVLRGASAVPVSVEVSAGSGLPGITIIGMADTMVHEARSRVRVALGQCGFEMPRGSVTVNLAPGDVKKTGTGLDLPIAVAILACTGQIPKEGLDGCLLVGELGLEGQVCPVRGTVAYAMLAAEQGLSLVRADERPHGWLISEKERPIGSIAQLKQGVGRLGESTPERSARQALLEVADDEGLDYGDVADQ